MHIYSFKDIQDLTESQIGSMRKTAASEMAQRSFIAVISLGFAVLIMLTVTPFLKDHVFVVSVFLGLLIPGSMIRILLSLNFTKLYTANQQWWLRAFFVSTSVMALSWGILCAFTLVLYGDAFPILIAGIMTSAISFGSLSSLSMNLSLMRMYHISTMLPTVIVGVWLGTSEAYSITVLFGGGLFYLLVQSNNINRTYWNALINATRLDGDTRQRLHDLTYRDPLTGLPNRALFIDRLQQSIREAKRHQIIVGVMILGLDRFIKINDTLGYQAGDELLKQVALRLEDTVRDEDTISRVTGDTFAIVLSDVSHTRDLARVAAKLLERLSLSFEISDLELFVSASIGITMFPVDGDDPDILIKNAEAAMHRVKEQGGNGYQYYETAINSAAMDRLQLETKLRYALERQEFQLHYQPKLDITSGKISGLEALMRWNPDGGTPVSPIKFIPMLEDTGLIVLVGEWVLRTACRQHKIWTDAGLSPGTIAVNLSARQFRDANLVSMIKRVLEDTATDASQLELEITESMLMEHSDRNTEVLTQLHEMGIKLSIDDFGTGYSSLSYLKRMPIHTLKIDRSFVKDITVDANDAAVVQAVIAMAHNLRIRVVAEGVETSEQLAFLHSQACDEIQGYHFSRPIPAEELRILLERMNNPINIDHVIASDKSRQQN